jgi:hypothetical protein
LKAKTAAMKLEMEMLADEEEAEQSRWKSDKAKTTYHIKS